jgi:transposase InsO family protein
VLEGIAASIGTIGDAYDNALAETTIGLYKTEAVARNSPFLAGPAENHRRRRVRHDGVGRLVHNARRLHSLLEYVPPDEYESAGRSYFSRDFPRSRSMSVFLGWPSPTVRSTF